MKNNIEELEILLKELKLQLEEITTERDEILVVIKDVDTMLSKGKPITPKSKIRMKILIALKNDPLDVIFKKKNVKHENMPDDIKDLKNQLEEITSERDDLLGLLNSLESILHTGGSVNPRSIIRASLLIALQKDPIEVM
jgi:3-methyladenine DNA glycosylase/8-oxoguanine DNA glycosylase